MSGNYVVHFSSGQGLEREAHETLSPRPRPVNLSVAGHRFQCQLPGVGDATGSEAVKSRLSFFSSWPLVGNEGSNLYIGILGIHSLIPH